MEVTVNPIFFPMVPERKPRTLCGCHPVTFIKSFRVTPSGRFNRSSTFSVLLPSRAPADFGLAALAVLAAFFAGLAFLPDFALDGVTRGRFGAAVAFVVGFGSWAAGRRPEWQCFRYRL